MSLLARQRTMGLCSTTAVLVVVVGCGTPASPFDAGQEAGLDTGLEADVEDEPIVDAPPDPLAPRPLFDLSATAEPAGFFDYPFPSDLRTTASGAPDLTNFYEPTRTTLLQQLRDAVARDIRGFSPLAGVYLRFDRPLDPASLPPDIESSLLDEATAFLVDVDPSSPHRGERWPVEVSYYSEGGRYWLPDTLVVRPPAGSPLRPATSYAVVIGEGLLGADGRRVRRAEAFDELLAEEPPADRTRELAVLEPLIGLASEQGFLERVLVATVFTTADHLGEMRLVRRWLHDNVEAPQATSWQLLRSPDEASSPAVYQGEFELMELFSGEPPYLTPGEGVITIDEAGEPLAQQLRRVRFVLTVPGGTPPAAGWPIALYAHGANGDAESFVDFEGELAASVGLAMISLDNPMHGDRSPNGDPFVEYLIDLVMRNPVAGRDLYRHGIVDQMQLARLACGGLTVPAEVGQDGRALTFDCRELIFVGHSMGSQIGAMVVGVEPLIRSAFLSEGGGGAATALVLRKTNGMDIEAMVAMLLGVDLEQEPLSPDHPVVGLVITTLLDPADPLSYAYGPIREPSERPTSLLMTEGLDDDQTLPDAIEALAAAFGLPIIEPVERSSRSHEIWGIESVAAPVTWNVTCGPAPATGGLLQFAGVGHYVFYEREEAQAAYLGWLTSSLLGEPTVIDIQSWRE